jgi:hypothetical protein
MRMNPETRAILSIISLSILCLAFSSSQSGPPHQKRGGGLLKEIPIPVIHVKGSHYEVGFQIGTKLKAKLAAHVSRLKSRNNWGQVKAEAILFLQHSKKYVPEYVEEIQGAADAVGLELEDLFPTICEEIGSPGYILSHPMISPKMARFWLLTTMIPPSLPKKV